MHHRLHLFKESQAQDTRSPPRSCLSAAGDLAMSTPTTTTQDKFQSRLPDPTQFFPELAAVSGAMSKATRNGSIPQTTISLAQLRAGQIVGSTYHTVRQIGLLRKAGETEERITAVASWQDAPYFTDAERVALELVEAVLTPNPFGERVPDELYAKASATTTTGSCGRSLWRSARSASSSRSRPSPSRSPVRPPERTTLRNARQAQVRTRNRASP
jgi:alkylhydroperoxidase family enzyme